jgi:ABC-type uncharacterized transport system permease subunit
MRRLHIRKRPEIQTWRSILVLVISVGLSILLSALLLFLQGKNGGYGIRLLFSGAFGSLWALEDCLIKAAPIYLCSLGVGIAFRLQIWNIGAEGQYALGAVGASAVALHLPNLPGPAMLAAMLSAAFLCGGLWGFIPALLKLKLNANEIIVTLMLNYVAILFLEYLVYGPWKDPVSFGFPMTPEFPAAAVVGPIGSIRLNWGIALCIVCGLLFHLFFRYSRAGFELKICGENIKAARYAHIPYRRFVMIVMVFSGAMAGWAGFLEASATIGRLQPSIIAGYGYTAIVVAWLARLNPFSIAVGSFLLAGLRVGVENLQLDLQVPAAFGGIIEGLVLLTVLAGGFFTHYQVEMRTHHDR